jgi:hypothetical protein
MEMKQYYRDNQGNLVDDGAGGLVEIDLKLKYSEETFEEMYEILRTVLIRITLERAEKGRDAVFPCAALRETIGNVLKKARNQ